MAVHNVETKCWILALFIRSDGQRFLLGDGAYEFTSKQQHFSANTMSNDVVEIQGNDGYMLAGTVRRPNAQSFDGYIGTNNTTKSQIESYRRQFFAFFRKNYYYKVVYVFPDGSAIQRTRGFIVDAPEVKELYQFFPEYHVALNFEDVNYYSYDENEEGEEIYGKSATLYPAQATGGGLIWDEDGIVWDANGATWEQGGGGSVVVSVDSIDYVSPIITIQGEAINPSITNITTGTTLQYTGTVNAGQTLVIDCKEQTAKLDGTSVVGNVAGDWILFAPGNNTVSYSATNVTLQAALIQWQEVVG